MALFILSHAITWSNIHAKDQVNYNTLYNQYVRAYRELSDVTDAVAVAAKGGIIFLPMENFLPLFSLYQSTFEEMVGDDGRRGW